jgi:tetratricopeptide (TPR) repeat protein
VSEARYLLKDGIVSERLGHYPDALDRYDRALERIGSVPGERAPLELAVAGVKYRQGHFHEGIEWSEHAAEHAEQAGDRASLAHAHYLLHANKTALGITDPAHTRLALPILEEVGDLVGQSSLLNNLGIEAYYAGRWDDAIDLYRGAGELSARAGDVVNVARARNNEAEIRSDQGRLVEAGELLDEAQRVWRAAHYTVGMALTTSNLGRLAARSGRFEEADGLLRDARERFEALGSEALAQEADARRVECFVLSGRFQEALELLPRVAAEAGREGVLPAFLERLYGYALVQARRPDEAGAHFDGSKELAQSVGATYELALTLEAVGDGAAARAILEDLGVVATPRIPLP